MAHHADARRHLDERGYIGTLIHGDNPLKLFEKPVRDRIVDSYYWKEQCFGLNAATILDRAVDLNCIGGTFGVSQKPTPFLCLAFKLLQLTPEKEIIEFYLSHAGEEFKYLRALAAFYVRLTYEKDEDVYMTLEHLMSDSRKLRRRTREGWALTYVDEFVDDLLQKNRVCATTLPKLNPRGWLEEEGRLDGPRTSALGEDIDALLEDDEEETRSPNGDALSTNEYHEGATPDASGERNGGVLSHYEEMKSDGA